MIKQFLLNELRLIVLDAELLLLRLRKWFWSQVLAALQADDPRLERVVMFFMRARHKVWYFFFSLRWRWTFGVWQPLRLKVVIIERWLKGER